MLDYIAQLHGWCDAVKRDELMRLVDTYEPAVVCEIGVFGGKSLLPMALECQKYGGICYAVDPWSMDAVLEGTVRGIDAEWWQTVDLQAIKRQFIEAMLHCEVSASIRMLEGCWSAVHPAVPEIHLGHLDGNHSPEVSLADAKLMLAKLAPGGWLVYDDTDAHEQRAALQLVGTQCNLVRSWNTWAVYRKRWA